MLFPGFLPAPEARAGATKAAGVWAELARGEGQSEERGKEDKRAVEDEYLIIDGQRKLEKKQVWRGCSLTAVCSSLFCICCVPQFPEGVPILWVMDQRGDFTNAFTSFWSQIQPSCELRCYWVTLLIYSRDTASPTFVHAVPLCWNGLIKILLPWKLLASSKPKLKSPVPNLHSCCNQDHFLFTKTMEQRLILMLNCVYQVCHLGHNVFLMFQLQIDL